MNFVHITIKRIDIRYRRNRMIDYLTFIEELKTFKNQVMQHGITNYPHIDSLIKKYEDKVKQNEEK